jgi:FMN phosphatase YigB (HAD superfamily)
MKPEPAIFAAAEKGTRCAGPQILYIDDFPQNITAAAARGWQSILHVSSAETIARVLKILRLPTGSAPDC